MESVTQIMYWVGTLVMLIVSFVIATKVFQAQAEEEYEDWLDEWKERIKTEQL